MKIVKYNNIEPEKRSDGRIIHTLINHTFVGGRDSKFFRVKIPAGTIEKEHMHTDSEEIFIFLRPGQIIVNSQAYDLDEGDLIFLEKSEKHKIIATTDMELLGIKNPNLDDKIITENENN